MTADPMQRAREMLAAEYEASTDAPEGSGIRFHAANVRTIGKRDYADWKDKAALRVIAALLTREAEVRGGERERAARICDERAAGRLRLYEENGASINACKAVEAEECATAIRSAPAVGD